jgi:hypothetical protein
MGTTHVVVPDPHAHFQHNNDRAIWLGHLINDVKPDVVVVGGDLADMPSLSSYDRGKKSFQGRSYYADISAAHDFNERVWGIVKKAKRRLPKRYILIGNHERRIDKTIDLQPELEGTISMRDLGYERYYDEIVPYNGRDPGVINIDGINYAHFFISGVMGKPIGGNRPASAILSKRHESCTAFDLHLLDYAVDNAVAGRKIQGLVAGCFQDYHSDWAGNANTLWWRGLLVKRNVEAGNYDPEFISIENLRREYGKR